MSSYEELRDDVARIVYSTDADFESTAARILALVAERLLSDGAIDALLQRELGWIDYDRGLTYEDMPGEEQVEYRYEGRHYIMAALDAAGLIPAETEEK